MFSAARNVTIAFRRARGFWDEFQGQAFDATGEGFGGLKAWQEALAGTGVAAGEAQLALKGKPPGVAMRFVVVVPAATHFLGFCDEVLLLAKLHVTVCKKDVGTLAVTFGRPHAREALLGRNAYVPETVGRRIADSYQIRRLAHFGFPERCKAITEVLSPTKAEAAWIVFQYASARLVVSIAKSVGEDVDRGVSPLESARAGWAKERVTVTGHEGKQQVRPDELDGFSHGFRSRITFDVERIAAVLGNVHGESQPHLVQVALACRRPRLRFRSA